MQLPFETDLVAREYYNIQDIQQLTGNVIWTNLLDVIPEVLWHLSQRTPTRMPEESAIFDNKWSLPCPSVRSRSSHCTWLLTRCCMARMQAATDLASYVALALPVLRAFSQPARDVMILTLYTALAQLSRVNTTHALDQQSVQAAMFVQSGPHIKESGQYTYTSRNTTKAKRERDELREISPVIVQFGIGAHHAFALVLVAARS